MQRERNRVQSSSDSPIVEGEKAVSLGCYDIIPGWSSQARRVNLLVLIIILIIKFISGYPRLLFYSLSLCVKCDGVMVMGKTAARIILYVQYAYTPSKQEYEHGTVRKKTCMI